MGIVTDIQPLLDANRQRAELAAKQEPVTLKVAETPSEYGKVSASISEPSFALDANAIAVYAQLKIAAKTNPTLDTATCLQATALAAKIKILKHSELETRGIYDSSIWQTLPSSAITRLQKLSATDYIVPQRNTIADQSLLLSWQAGTMTVLFFDAQGLVIQRLEMAETRCRIIKIPANVYYTFITSDHCLYLAVTSQNTAMQAAEWTPVKDHPEQSNYRKQLVDAKIGDRIGLCTLKL